MCGFAYLYGGEPHDADAVEEILRLRGPDGRGTAQFGPHWMLHRRLSVIDLTEDSAQPFASQGAVTVYNGELYNYEELRSNISGLTTSGDTEVFARLLTDDGLDRAVGMYAGLTVAGEHVHIARDRFGIKPLYIGRKDGKVAVASQLRCMPHLLGPLEIDKKAIASFLRFGSVVGTTMYEGVEEVPPGTKLTLRDGVVVDQKSLPPVERHDLATALRSSMKRHLVADVPVAVLLSGGLDSAIVAKLAAEAGGVVTGITLSPGGDIDESDRARRTAEAYGLDHVVVPITESEVLDSIEEFFEAMDQPSIDGLNTFLVSRAVRDAGFKVALSGLGADELFGGYSAFKRIHRTRQLRHLPTPILKSLLRRSGANRKKIDRWVSARQDAGELALISRELFSASEVREMTGSSYQPVLPNLPGADPVMQSELGCYMQPMLLRDSDAMSMANSVELRVPFLDDAVVGAAFARSAGARATEGKLALANALDDGYLKMVAGEKKTGFTLPIGEWASHELIARGTETRDLKSGSAAIDGNAGSIASDSQRWSRIVADRWLGCHSSKTS